MKGFWKAPPKKNMQRDLFHGIPQDPWDGTNGIFTDPSVAEIYGVHVAKYTSPMDPMGHGNP